MERTVGIQQLPASLPTPAGEFHELSKPLLASHLLGSNCMAGLGPLEQGPVKQRQHQAGLNC